MSEVSEPITGTFDIDDDVHLYYETSGTGPWVTFLHPGLWDSRTWDPQFASWPDRYRLLRYDFRGYGRSSRLDGEPFSHVRDLLALLDHLDIERTAIVGCSMGGGVAIDFTLVHPERTGALVAAATALGGVETLEEEEEWWEEHALPIEKAMQAGNLPAAIDAELAIWAPLGVEDEAGRRIREIAMDNIHELTMDESAVEELDPPAAVRLGEIDIPTLVVIAEHDPPEMLRLAQLVARGVLDGRSVSVDADHVVNLRDPEAFDAAVLPFLASTLV